MTFEKMTCEEFVEVLASKEPVPGGGGASALVGALGTALGHMVGSLTVGKKKYADVEEDVRALMSRATLLQSELLSLIQKDADAFAPLAKAYGLPKDTPEEQQFKEKVMEAALQTAAAAPLEIMEKCCESLELMKEFAAKGSVLALSDAGVGAAFCRAALEGASLNIFINTKAMKNREYAEALNARADQLLKQYTSLADEVFQDVSARLR